MIRIVTQVGDTVQCANGLPNPQGWVTSNANATVSAEGVVTFLAPGAVMVGVGSDWLDVFTVEGVVVPPAPPATGNVFEQLAQMTSGESQSVALGGVVVAGSVLDYGLKGVYDPVANVVHIVAQSHDGPPTHFSLDMTTDLWSTRAEPPEPGHNYHSTTIDPATGDVYVKRFNSGVVARYSGGSWTDLPPAPYWSASRIGAIHWHNNALYLWETYEGLQCYKEGVWTKVYDHFSGEYHLGLSSGTDGRLYFGGGGMLNVLRWDGVSVVDDSEAPHSFGPRHGAFVEDYLFAYGGSIYKHSQGVWDSVGTHDYFTPDGDMSIFVDLGPGFLIVRKSGQYELFKK